MRVHTYVITTDAGSAPNYDPPCVTLAVCKPRIRRKAQVGDLVLAFAGSTVNPHEPHAVVWAGIVSEILPIADYWNDRRFTVKKPGRTKVPDNFYKPLPGGGFVWQPNPIHGPEALGHDTGGQSVLIFKPAWRFGAMGPILPEHFGLRMTGGRRGERLVDLTERDWQRLSAWLNAQPQLELTDHPTRRRSCAGSRKTASSLHSRSC